MIATMPVPFVDLRAQHAPLTEAIERAFREILARGDFIMGAAVERFETEYAGYIGARHADRLREIGRASCRERVSSVV